MEVRNTPLKDLLVLQPKLYQDSRGFFTERFNAEVYTKLGLNINYIQDNHSRSKPRVLRGLHFQENPQQAKLVGCIRGHIWDVAVDIREGSPTYGQHYGLELSGDNATMLYIPAGFAHGFCVLGDDNADVIYKVDGRYNPQGEGGIIYNDPTINIDWPVKDPILSDKDAVLPAL